MKKFLFLVLIVSVLFTSCSIKKGNQDLFDDAVKNRVQIGQTIADVIGLLGQANAVITRSKKGGEAAKVYSWTASKGKSHLMGIGLDAKTTTITVTVVKGKVVKVDKTNAKYK